MNPPDIIKYRLANQRLSGTNFKKPAEPVKWLGAIQAQDFAAAKWAIGLRLPNVTDYDIEDAFNKGEILRTHILRPTWHFVYSRDIKWMIQLSGPRVNAGISTMYRKFELDDKIFRRSNKIIADALKEENYLTRSELIIPLHRAKINTDDLRLTLIVMRAELDGLICSGPRKGKQFTYALLEERAPKAKTMNRDESLAELAKRYFFSRGPATIPDFAWWSGLTIKDSRSGLEMIKSHLICETIEGNEYYFSDKSNRNIITDNFVNLLPNFDEYLVGYKNRKAAITDKNNNKLKHAGYGIFSNTILINGKIGGTWKRVLKKNSVDVSTKVFTSAGKEQKNELKSAVNHYKKFISGNF